MTYSEERPTRGLYMPSRLNGSTSILACLPVKGLMLKLGLSEMPNQPFQLVPAFKSLHRAAFPP